MRPCYLPRKTRFPRRAVAAAIVVHTVTKNIQRMRSLPTVTRALAAFERPSFLSVDPRDRLAALSVDSMLK